MDVRRVFRPAWVEHADVGRVVTRGKAVAELFMDCITRSPVAPALVRRGRLDRGTA